MIKCRERRRPPGTPMRTSASRNAVSGKVHTASVCAESAVLASPRLHQRDLEGAPGISGLDLPTA